MKIAHLILSHNNPQQLERLIRRLEHPDADFYIHLDKKTPIEPFLKLEDIGCVYFIKNRVKAGWGNYSLVQANLNAFEEMLNNNRDYDYFNVLSGQDYPIVATETIHAFFKENPGKIFMHAEPINEVWTESINRMKIYYLGDFDIPAKFTVQKWVNTVLPERKMPSGLIPYGRSQWFTIAPVYARYLIDYLKQNPRIVRFFRLTWAPDETMFHTVLCNSAHKEALVNNNLRYIDFSQGGLNPKVLTLADAEEILKSGKFFARKFDSNTDSGILDYLDKAAL